MKIFIHSELSHTECQVEDAGRIQVRPAMDLVENRHGLILYCDMPGVNPDRLTLDLENDTLYIKGETRLPQAIPGKIHALEFDDLVYTATFTLPPPVVNGRIDARLNDGVLSVCLRPNSASGPRRIPVDG